MATSEASSTTRADSVSTMVGDEGNLPTAERTCRPPPPRSADEAGSLDSRRKVDKHGLPLAPRPSRFPDDPLNWPAWRKWAVLLVVSYMAFLAPYNAALINPSLTLVARAFHVSLKQASYPTTTAIIMGGLSPFLWVPLSQSFGRRPIALISMILTIAGAVFSALSPNYACLIGSKAINGLGYGGMKAFGTIIVNDVFFVHERGQKLGVYTFFLTNGAHVAFIIGGFIGQDVGWRWVLWTGALSTTLALVLAIPFFPETLFVRDAKSLAARNEPCRTWWQMLFTFHHYQPIDRRAFLRPLRALREANILLPFIHYTVAWTLGNILPAVTVAAIFSSRFGLKPAMIGLSFGVCTIIGCVLGELCAGALSDHLMAMHAVRRRRDNCLEVRLPASGPDGRPCGTLADKTLPTVSITSASSATAPSTIRHATLRLLPTIVSSLLLPAGLLIFGFTVSRPLPPSSSSDHHPHHLPLHNLYAPLTGLGLACCGLQISSTLYYAYIGDAAPRRVSDAAVLLNLGRGLSFVIGFIALPLRDRLGYKAAWSVFAAVAWVSWWGVGWLIWRGMSMGRGRARRRRRGGEVGDRKAGA